MTVAVVDDERPFSDRLQSFIARYAAENGIEAEVTCFEDGIDIADDFRSKWDIIFLDIQMAHMNGLDTARHIRACDSDVIIIFVTTMAQYAINGYEVDAFDYVLKPLEYPQFALRMRKAVKEVEKKKSHAWLYLKKWSDWVKVSTDDLLYIEVTGHTLKYVTADETYEMRAKIGDAENELAGRFFDWSDLKVSRKDDTVTASVRVKNTGSTPGRDVVEIYAQAPYIPGGTEKSAVVLAGYAKTKELKAGESQTVTVTFDLKDIASYDHVTNKTWTLDAGTYYVTAGRDAHDAVNNILSAKGFTAANGMTGDGSAAMASSFSLDSLRRLDTAVTGAEVTNRFDNDALEGVPYLSRSDWSMMDGGGLRASENDVAGLSKCTDAAGTAGTMVLSGKLAEAFAMYGADSADLSALAAGDFPSKEDYVYGAAPEKPLTLAEMKGLAYDDPKWDELLNQTKLSEQHILFNNSGYGTKAIEAVQKPKTFEYDGPAGISNFITGKNGFGFPNTITLAATWDPDLASEYGKLIGEDAILTKTSGWYAPAVNLHRSPFSGRNYEYFSEDPFQTGLIASNIIKTVQQKGVYVYLKHFALNDQETNRNANGQVAVFAREQAIRELYLKPFRMGVEDGGAKGIMLSMNRIGTTWSGDHYALLTAVARGEWGFEGMFLTDYLGSMNTTMIDKYLAAGGYLVLSTNELKLSDVKQNWCRAYLRDSTHRVLYHQANSLAVNGLGSDVKFEVGTPVYRIALWTLMGLLAVYLACSIFMMIRYGRMTEQEFADSRVRTAKSRRIKNIILLAVIVILAVVFFIVYFPVLQKAFLM